MRDEGRVSKECWEALVRCVEAASDADAASLQAAWDTAHGIGGRFAWSARDGMLELLLVHYMELTGRGSPQIHGVGDVANESWRDAGSWTGESELEFFEVLTSASTENLQTSTVRDGVLVPFASIAYMISATPGGGTNLKDAERRLTGSTTI